MCPSCHSHSISRSRKRKLADSLMRWMGKVAYRCRDCQRRFYINVDEHRRLRRAAEWQRRTDALASEARERKEQPGEGVDRSLDAKI
jgi:transposase-like protein